MEQEIPFSELLEKAEEKILLGNELIKHLEDFSEIPGVQKVQRKIYQEIKFLQKVIKNHTLKINHVQCSNLTHYEFLVKILKLQRDVVHVDCGFPVDYRENPLRVDIVCENGLKWIKAIARNSKSLTDAARGEASYGARSIIDQAQEFVEAAAQNLCMFKCPKVVFYFSQTIENELLTILQEEGVEIASLEQPSEVVNGSDLINVSTLNLDITTMLAYISNVCNGGCNWIFQEPILTEQAEKERECPLKPILDKLFMDKRLICCATAYKSFQDIVSLLGGRKEKERAQELAKRIEILPDVATIPEELATIKYSGKINERSLLIFAFGMHMKAVTVTSNKAFVRSAKMQGINVPVFTHQARALTEAKEETAKPV
ncbi:hypothetical protein FF38_08146 [Lucilia cuprina]|uniref:DUF1308 domain-containing protein n=1 Tax=Lucilia cuprina TaxID=7375 RepID=A0A0L0C0M4_LUCCU|nr:UPF0415 protein C7orf25 like protein [Lucilia cuprina]KNC25863.1 hypothetical protein FF38_08146 [Lucilia cuprina]